MGARLLKFDDSAITKAAACVRSGGLVVFPTDTVYGLGCDPRIVPAVKRLVEVKRKEAGALPILCDSLESAEMILTLNDTALAVAKKEWPGALTIVGRAKVPFPEEVERGTGTVGVRVPRSDRCLELIRQCGGYLIGTSANISGDAPFTDARSAKGTFGRLVDYVLDGGTLSGSPSTVVRIEGKKIIVLRQGRVRVKVRNT